ncbi:MAG: response regulator transcription factor [Magnetococcus sp. THC-1_WYH]
MEPSKINPYLLLVDDDQDFCTMLGRYLIAEGFRCRLSHDGESALESAMSEPFDAIVLDVMLPQLNGIQVLQRLRKSGNETPVLMLTARGEDNHSIRGLESGADDYLTKPCNPKVLVAHLRAVLRRAITPAEPGKNQPPIHVGTLMLHPGARMVTMDGVPLDLTSAEFSILHVLLLAAGQPVSKEILCLKGLGRKLNSYDRSVDIHISNLRRKLGHGEGNNSPIHTVRGIGYMCALPIQG